MSRLPEMWREVQEVPPRRRTPAQRLAHAILSLLAVVGFFTVAGLAVACVLAHHV